MKKSRKLLFILFCFCFIFLQSKTVLAATTPAGKDDVKLERKTFTGTLKSSDIYASHKYYSANTGWSKYASMYYYNQLTADEKKLYDSFNAMCLNYMLTKSEGITKVVDGSPEAMTDFIPYSNMSSDEAYNVAVIFMFSEPEYYFLNNSTFPNITNGKNYLSLGMYANYLDGDARSTTTTALKSKLDTWTSQIQTQTGDYAKAKEAHDIIISNVAYNTNSNDYESDYAQSIISFLNSGTTVCTGYTKMYELLCDAAGLNALSVTSTQHAWNKVEISGAWYNVDCTWDDTDPGIIYTYFAKSDSTIQKGNEFHNVEGYWYTYTQLPGCDSDSTTDLATYNGQDYSAVYNYHYYISKYPDVAVAFGGDQQKTIAHFVTFGMKEGRQANSNFNVQDYKSTYKDLRQVYDYDLAKYYNHYIKYGQGEGRKATTANTITDGITSYNGVDYSLIYNYSNYIANNKDVAQAFPNDDISTLKHFVEFGMKEGRISKDSFNVRAYRAAYPDLRQAFLNDWEKYFNHYILFGKSEGRTTTGSTDITNGITTYDGADYSLVYNYNYYIQQNPDVAVAYPNDDIAVLNHFINCGMGEGRNASADFVLSTYKANNADLISAFGGDNKSYYMHYIKNGAAERRIAK